MNDSDQWALAESSIGYKRAGDFVRIVTYTNFTPSQGNEPRYTMYVSISAIRKLGDKKYVQLLMNTSGSKAMLRLVPCEKTDRGAKHIPQTAKTPRLAGAERVIKHHKMPCGYYFFDDAKQAYVLTEDD